MEDNSLQILENSDEDIVIKELYFVSIMPKCSVSIVINDISNSQLFLDSKNLKNIFIY